MSVRVVTGTGFHGQARSEFKQKVEALGLVCSGELILAARHELLTSMDKLDIQDGGSSTTPVIQELQIATPASTKGRSSSSPASVEVKVSNELSKAPKKSTAAEYHRCPAKSLKYFDKLEVRDPDSGSRYSFSMSDPSHCALVFYDDSADGHELAYCDLLSTYSYDGEVYIEHGYLFDRADVMAHPKASQLMASHAVAEDELVNCVAIYHSPARVIEGEFWLYGSQSQAQRARKGCADKDQLFMFTTKTWDRKAGRFLSRPKNVRFCG
ncbi:hypothetical protein WJX73_004504 [Symbiochloris irregularis]|uniref:Uncharacterized protein n=1 Tax=Symbiochloris irregularis TaxID=706552 RepID=A0AAW1NRI2_9CHLO